METVKLFSCYKSVRLVLTDFPLLLFIALHRPYKDKQNRISFFTPLLITRPRMGPSLGFVTGVFLCVWSSVTYNGLFYCTIGFVLRHWRLIAPLELYCAIVSQYYLSFK